MGKARRRNRRPGQGRIVEKIDRLYILQRSSVDPDTDCWNWDLYKNKGGYGTAMIAGCGYRAHRLSYAIFKGPVPQGYLICHACDNPSCVNPSHLWAGTPKDNTLDMMRKGRHGKRGRAKHKE